MTGPSMDRHPSRRAMLMAGGSFTLAFFLGGKARAAGARHAAEETAAAVADGRPAFAPNAFVRIDPTGPIRLVMPNVEMGQGIYTSEATLMAEELDVGLDQIVVEHAPPSNVLYATKLLGEQATGGSTSIRAQWLDLRRAGAAARAMLLAAAAGRWGVAVADCTVERGTVRHPASGRSLTYGALAAEANAQPVPDPVKLREPGSFRLIGKPLRRLDGAEKVDGSMVYSIDLRVPEMKVAALVMCPVIGGRVASVDDSAARAVSGVRDVVRLENAVAVTADHFWAARKGVEALDIAWNDGADADFSTEGMFAAMDQVSRGGTAIVARQEGNLEQEGRRLEAIYQAPMLSHAPMEPPSALVHVRADGCDVWVGTQVPMRALAAASRITGFPPERIAIHNQYIGGGFGRRLDVDFLEVAIEVAKAVPYPVKLVLTREHDIQHDVPRPAYRDRIAAVIDQEGKPIAWTDRITGASVLQRWLPAALRKDGLDPDAVDGAAETPYDIPNLRVEWAPFHLPSALQVGWWRGVGMTHNLFKVECFIDELAHAGGKDPVDYRKALLGRSPRVLGVLNLAAAAFGWTGSSGRPRIGRGVAVAAPFGSYVCCIVEVEVTPAGEIRLRRCVTAVDVGVAINPNTIEAQVQGGLVFGWTGALYSALTYVNGAVQESNFNNYRMMRINETPPIEVHVVPSVEAPGGIGEVGTAVAAPALGNAIFAATGVRLRSLPFERRRLVTGDLDGSLASIGAVVP